MKVTRKEALSIPNIMGYFRLALIPVFAVLYLNAETREAYILSLAVLALSGLTDVFDGKVARRFDMVTELGKFLDPLADKLTLGTVIVCMSKDYPGMWALIVLYVLKEGFMGVMGLVTLRARGRKLDGAMWYGKLCTSSSYVVLLLLLLFPGMPRQTSGVLIAVCAVLMLFTLVMYAMKFQRMWKE